MSDQLCLLTVHAHPDDESSKGAATVARYHSEGVRTVLVCCTGGEEGEILNPAMDRPEVRDDLPAVRLRELERATAIIGYDETVLLGYRDSGMAGSEANEDPACFAQAPLAEAVGKLVAVIRRERPQVVVTYPDEQSHYPHPDHLRVHEVSVAAFDAAGDPTAYPGTGEPWQPSKLYYVHWSGAMIGEMHDKFLELGLESPFDDSWLERAAAMPREFTTVIDVGDQTGIRRRALLAHATQVDPESRFWFGLPADVAGSIHPVDEYVLASSLVGSRSGDSAAGGGGDPGLSQPEADLFAGVRGDRG